MRVLVIAAHPDDETFGCGGTIRRHFLAGHELRVVIAADGESSRPWYEGMPARIRIRTEQAAAALRCLSDCCYRPGTSALPDQRLYSHEKEVTDALSAQVRDFKPDRVYLQGADGNTDHAVTYRAGIVATRPIHDRPHPRHVLRYVIPEWRAWGTPYAPNYYVPFSRSVLNSKLQAARCYAGEMAARPAPHPGSELAMVDLARRDGQACGHDYAEAFEVVRWTEKR